MCRARRAHTADWPRPALTSCAADDGPATGPVSHNPTSTRGEDGRVTERDGTPVPGLTVPDVTRQLTWRVLGPLKGRAKSVLDWAGLRGEPPKTFQEAGRTYFVTAAPSPTGSGGSPPKAPGSRSARSSSPNCPRRGPDHAAALRPPARHPPAPHRPADHRRRPRRRPGRRTHRQFCGCSTRSANASRMITS